MRSPSRVEAFLEKSLWPRKRSRSVGSSEAASSSVSALSSSASVVSAAASAARILSYAAGDSASTTRWIPAELSSASASLTCRSSKRTRAREVSGSLASSSNAAATISRPQSASSPTTAYS